MIHIDSVWIEISDQRFFDHEICSGKPSKQTDIHVCWPKSYYLGKDLRGKWISSDARARFLARAADTSLQNRENTNKASPKDPKKNAFKNNEQNTDQHGRFRKWYTGCLPKRLQQNPGTRCRWHEPVQPLDPSWHPRALKERWHLWLVVTMVYHPLPWFTTVYQGLPPFTTVYHPLPRFTTLYHGLPPFTRVYHGLRKKTKEHPNYTWQLDSEVPTTVVKSSADWEFRSPNLKKDLKKLRQTCQVILKSLLNRLHLPSLRKKPLPSSRNPSPSLRKNLRIMCPLPQQTSRKPNSLPSQKALSPKCFWVKTCHGYSQW